MFRCLFDCDEVCAKFMEPAITIASRIAGVEYKLENVKSFHFENYMPQDVVDKLYQEIYKPGFIASLEPYEEALQAFEKIKKIPNVDIFIVTAPMEEHPTWAFERQHWINKHFEIPLDHIVITTAKYLVEGDLFYDDHVVNVEAWSKQRKGKCFLRPTSFNSTLECSVERADWNKVIDYIAKVGSYETMVN